MEPLGREDMVHALAACEPRLNERSVAQIKVKSLRRDSVSEMAKVLCGEDEQDGVLICARQD